MMTTPYAYELPEPEKKHYECSKRCSKYHTLHFPCVFNEHNKDRRFRPEFLRPGVNVE